MTGIRADANETVASGHVMRCITIAKELLNNGEEVLFFTADEQGAGLLSKAGMDYCCLHTKWDQLEEELPVLVKRLKEAGCTRILVDSYKATPCYVKELKKTFKVIYIDDLFETLYPADIIINYNAYHTRFPYKESYQNGEKLLLGTSYVPLREEFSNGNAFDQETSVEESKKSRKEVLLCCGGGDVFDALAGILSEAASCPDFKEVLFHTVVGSFHPNLDRLKELEAENSNIILHHNVKHMAELMARCDAAVSAAGTVLFELSAMQVPTVFFVCAENQKYDSEFFNENQRMLFAGDIRRERADCIKKSLNLLAVLLKDRKLQEGMKEKLYEVTDGKGAKRIAQEIILL